METDAFIHGLSSALDAASGDPLAHQIVEFVWLEVVEGRIETGARLPTVREVAIRLGVSPRTVEWAYAELARLGVTVSHAGEGTFVSLTPPPEAERARRREFHALCREAVERAEGLGFDVNEILDALAEFRTVERGAVSGETHE